MKMSRKSYKSSLTLSLSNQYHFTSDRLVIITFEDMFECNWFILNIVTCSSSFFFNITKSCSLLSCHLKNLIDVKGKDLANKMKALPK